MSSYNIMVSTDESTVVSEYIPEYSRSGSYQSEADLERELIKLLITQGYEHLTIRNEAELIANLRKQLELLNGYSFSDTEWNRFFAENIANRNENIIDKTRKIQEDFVQLLKRDNADTKNILLIDKKSIHNNRLQVINQYEETGGTHETRYDVTILVNGFPLVHIELKRRGIDIREAFNQIKRYQRDSFWAASGLYEYIQIFVITNGTKTKYYSNTTRNQHISESSASEKNKSKKTSHSFEFTSYWADGNNKVIADLVDFTKTFFAKHTLLNILTRYCVFTSDSLLLVMRPYQIAATERILSHINIANNYKKTGTVEAGGYVWHATGSGKTLTSFKTAQLITKLPFVEKVLFVVDRKDLDYQTIKEYDRFEKNSANGNTSTKILQKQLEDPNAKIIITTIQKLGIFIEKNRSHPVYNKHIVLIFDECHRSQFGEMHRKIVKSFKNYHIFGFTGTPIFPANASSSGNPALRTTEQAFGKRLHTYTVVHAINDHNVLPFRIDYINTMKIVNNMNDKQVQAIDPDSAMFAPERIHDVTKYILEHFDQKTKRNSFYSHNNRRVFGFNSIFAVSSIPVAMKYYSEFKKQLKERHQGLVVATIFSFKPNEDDFEGVLPDETFEADKLDKSSREFLNSAISDYNNTFSVNYDTSSDKFENYYKDLSMRMKNREIDLLIVVDMFLTGFDSTTLNTLWVDKSLKLHGLIQAFSRTNRILNSVKTFGNIVCFRDLKTATDDALALFGDKEAGGIVLLKTYDEYYNGYKENDEFKPGYTHLIKSLQTRFPIGQSISGEGSQKEFIRLFGAILRMKNILTSFDDFTGNEILAERDAQDYQSIYIDLYQNIVNQKKADKESIADDIVFEIELIKQIEVNVDYILMLVAKYHESNCTDKSILVTINKAIDSSIRLRSKKELIQSFINKVNTSTVVDRDWRTFVEEQKENDLSAIIETEKLKSDETRKFIESSFRDGAMRTTGMVIDGIMPPVSRFADRSRVAKKQSIIEKLMAFFEKYLGLV